MRGGGLGQGQRTTCSWPTATASGCGRRRVAHDEAGLSRLCRELVRLGVARVAVERPDGLLVERLLDAGLTRDRDASQPGRGGAAAVPSGGRQVRSLRRVRAVRARAHRPSPLPRAGARQRSDQGAAGADARTRAAGRAARRAVQPAARRARALLARRRRDLRRPRQPDRARVPGALPVADRRARRSARSASRSCSHATTTADAAAPPSCSSGCARRRPGAPANWKPTPAAGSCSRSSPRCERSSSRSACSTSEIAHAVRAHPDGAIFLLAVPRSQERRQPPPRCSPRSATAASATRPASSSPPTPA